MNSPETNVQTEVATASQWDAGAPQINSPGRYGASPGKEFLYTIPATGERPIRYAAEGLPSGLVLDAATGRISGQAAREGEYPVRLLASNCHGQHEKALTIVIRPNALALTPPLGWNSWNCFRGQIDADMIREIAKGMVSSGLAARGYTFVNIDSGWQSSERGGPFNAIIPHEGFPDMAGLCAEVHDLGLKLGIYSAPYVVPWGTEGCGSTSGIVDTHYPLRVGKPGKYVGMLKHEAEDAAQYAAWGIDYLKYDWRDTDMELTERMSRALQQTSRDMVFSITTDVSIQDKSVVGNLWRSNRDTKPTWESVKGNGFGDDDWSSAVGPGHWFDLDMLALKPRDEKQLSNDEAVACFTRWAIAPSPIFIDCIPGELDEFTLNLLSNEEVLAVNQDVLGKPAATVNKDTAWPIQVKPLSTGGYAVAFFNLSDEPGTSPELDLLALGLKRPPKVRDLWAKKDLDGRREILSVPIAAHSAKLFSLSV